MPAPQSTITTPVATRHYLNSPLSFPLESPLDSPPFGQGSEGELLLANSAIHLSEFSSGLNSLATIRANQDEEYIPSGRSTPRSEGSSLVSLESLDEALNAGPHARSISPQ